MILREIRIENFGGIHDMDMSLEDGFHMICEKNGWGKSTLAVFLKVMFYGFSGENAKIVSREREQFRPWSGGGTYGGYIRFDYNGGEYELRRTFQKKAADDTLTVTDLNTNLPVTIFGEIPGEKIYGLDADSFFKAIYIADGDCRSGASDRINERIGNPGVADTESGKLSDALEKLKGRTNRLTSDRVTGALSKTEDRIIELRNDISRRAVMEERFDLEKTEWDELRRKIGEKTCLLQKSRKDYTRAGERKALESEKDRYLDLKGRKETAEKLLQEEISYFGGRIPETDILTGAEERLTRIGMYMTKQADHTLTDTEEEELLLLSQRYGAGVEESVLERADSCAETLRELRALQVQQQPSLEQKERMAELARIYGKESAVPDQVRMGDLHRICVKTREQLRGAEEKRDQVCIKEQRRAEREDVILHSWEHEQARADRMREAALERLESRAQSRALRSSNSAKMLLWAAAVLITCGIILGVIAFLNIGSAPVDDVQQAAAGGMTTTVPGGQTVGNGIGGARITMFAGAVIVFVSGILCLGIRAAKTGAEKKAEAEDEDERERLQWESEIPLPEGIVGEVYLPDEKQENMNLLGEIEAEITKFEKKLGSAENELNSLLKVYGSSVDAGSEETEICRLEREVTEYQKLRASILEYEKKGYEQKIREAFEELKNIFPEHNFPEGEEKHTLLSIRREVERLDGLRDKDARASEAERELGELRKENDEFLGKYRELHPEYKEDADLINSLQQHLTIYRHRSDGLKSAAVELEKFEKEYDVSRFESLIRESINDRNRGEGASEQTEVVVSGEGEADAGGKAEVNEPEKLAKEMESLEADIEELRRLLKAAAERMSESEKELDLLDEEQTELDELLQRKKQYSFQHSIYKKTAEYLVRAKEDYLSSFIKPLQVAFEKHYKEISDTSEKYRIDVNLNLSCKKAGDYRPLERQSSGYKDLAFLCLRLALVDIMFGEEIPLLLMDDPLVHMDAEKAERAIKYLEKQKDHYQILYLTCHSPQKTA